MEPIKSSFDVTAGYDYQYWKATNPLYSEMNTLGEVLKTSKATDERHVLLSYYGRLNYSFDSRYMLTTTVRGTLLPVLPRMCAGVLSLR